MGWNIHMPSGFSTPRWTQSSNALRPSCVRVKIVFWSIAR